MLTQNNLIFNFIFNIQCTIFVPTYAKFSWVNLKNVKYALIIEILTTGRKYRGSGMNKNTFFFMNKIWRLSFQESNSIYTKFSIILWANGRFTINLFNYVNTRHHVDHNLHKGRKTLSFPAATHVGLGVSLLLADPLLSLSMILFDFWVSLILRGIICCKGLLIHCVLFAVHAIMSKDTP